MRERCAVHERTREGDFIGEFEVGADGDATGDARGFHAKFLHFAGDVKARHVALHAARQRKDDLGTHARAQAQEQVLDVEVARPEALHRVDDAVEHVVGARVLACVFDGDHVFAVLDDADHGLVAAVAAANLADIVVADIAAGAAVFDVFAQGDEGLAEALGVAFSAFEDMQSKPQGRFLPDPGQPRELVDTIFDHLRGKFHAIGCDFELVKIHRNLGFMEGGDGIVG